MEELVLAVPGLWADHHVLAVRELLEQDEGVTVVAVSALDRSVTLTFDPARTDAAKIAALLEKGGYQTGAADEPAPSPTDKPAWATTAVRVTATNAVDLAMSGDHRKY
jgi:copper chaperone CopZ